MFALCTFIDRERWVSALEPLLYPTGFTFYRPFSYEKAYFVPEQLGEQLSDPKLSQSLISQSHWNEGFFGLRFNNESAPDFLPLFVPLRKVELLRTERIDKLNLRFRLGPFVVPEQKGKPAVRKLPALDIAEAVGDPKQVKLFIDLREAEKEIASKWALSDDFPIDFWEALEKSISAPAMEKVRNTVALRLVKMSRRGEKAKLVPSEIDKSSRIFGFGLEEKTTYDLSFAYFRLREKPEEMPQVEYQFSLTNPSEEIQASRRTVSVHGRYRAEDIWICPLKAFPGPILLSLEPCKLDQPNVVADQTNAKMVGLKMPMLVKPLKWPKARLTNLVFALFSLVGILTIWRFYSYAADAWQKVLLVMIAALISLFVSSAKDVLVQKD